MDGTTAQAIEISLANEAVTQIGFKRLSPDAAIPTKAHLQDSGFDLVASADVIIEPGATVVVPTGIAVQLPAGYEATVRPRSGVTSKTKLRVQFGSVDNGYGGEIGIIVDNIANIEYDFIEKYGGEEIEVTERRVKLRETHAMRILDGILYAPSEKLVTDGTYKVSKGDKLAQLVITRLPDVEAVEVFDVEDTARGENGFGSSGV